MLKAIKLFQNKKGFTLVELLIFIAIFSIVVSIFFVVLVSISNVQVRGLASNEVNQQSQFLLSTIQRYVESASLIELPTGVSTTTLKLRMPNNSEDKLIFIFLEIRFI
ncbi:MAG: PulJ/GspJ family protein [Minisyncoccia bacterium]